MPKTFYAVKSGRRTGTSPRTEESVQTSLFSPVHHDRTLEEAEFEAGEVQAYVDGSYNDDDAIGGYGLVLVKDATVLLKDLGSYRHPDLIQSGQIAGELLGAMRAVELALANGYTHMNIVYDYEGIRRFARGEWTANTFATQDYQRTMERYLKKVDVSFIKVKSHSGNCYNDLADRLAKRAVGLRN